MRSANAKLLMPWLSGKIGTPSAKMRFAVERNQAGVEQADRGYRRARMAVNHAADIGAGAIHRCVNRRLRGNRPRAGDALAVETDDANILGSAEPRRQNAD